MQHLLATTDFSREDLQQLFDRATQLAESGASGTELAGRTVTTAFFEDSTRTRLSFELAAQRLGAHMVSFTAATSSMNKGESLRDTVQTLDAMGSDVIVIRHRSVGAPKLITKWVQAHVVNGGDGPHDHPTQGLLNAFTVYQHRGLDLNGFRLGIVGDVHNSRVSRPDIAIFQMLGAKVTLIGPPALMPNPEAFPDCDFSNDFDDVLPKLDAVHMLRIRREWGSDANIPSMSDFISRYSLTEERANKLPPDALIMHAGPVNRGIEMGAAVVDSDRSTIREQVRNGVLTRMALLEKLVQSDS